ncbi:MAG TPA: hypothetical protein VKU19_20310 [Bryobacteraceae bacterium]|nr:hypothetical protein [Bryobacteraceae bacterium]
MKPYLRSLKSAALLLALLAAPIAAVAQTPVIVGYPANFDAVNNTGETVNGFEMEADGISSSDITRIFGGVWTPGQPCVIRYCQGVAIDFPGGVKIRWTSPWDPATQTFTLGTPAPSGVPINGESCWTLGLGANYPAAGCEHFGISTSFRQPTNIVYRWLVPDPANPGQLTYYTGNTLPVPGTPPPPPVPIPLPQPIVVVNPPAQPGGAPIVDFRVPAPAPKAQLQFGDAQWVRVFKTELNRQVDLNELMGGNPVVPEDPAQLENDWKLIQVNPHSANSGVLHNQGQLGNGSHAVIRRYEFHTYTGAYDPLTHEALCLVALCASPGNGELGDLIGAQNAAVNVETPSITVVKVGSGNVNGSGTNVKISCGNVCTAPATAGTVVSLTASAPSNGVFSGWSGACTGSNPNCSVTVNDSLTATATFTTVYTLSIGRGGSGTVSGTPNGEFGTFINCGSSCSAKFDQGTTVSLTATPLAGHVFVNWTGACSGTVPTCDVTVSKDTQVQANFK